jgi:GTPase SAR1 family protein
MPLLSLPSLALILGPFGSGKTSLLRYLILENIQNIVGMVVFSNTGKDTWNTNYSFVNQRYVYDEWDETLIPKLIELGRKIKKANPNHHLLLVFDDSIGMAKSMFTNKDSKRLLTTLRHYNISIVISVHQLQVEVSTLIRNNLKDIFLFQQSEVNGLKLLADTWGKPSNNLNDPKEFINKVSTLPKNTFMHYNKESHEWKSGQCPYPIPEYRVYLHPEDMNADVLVLPGNSPNYNLESIEKTADQLVESDAEEDTRDLYRKEAYPDGEEEEGQEGEEVDFLDDLAKDLREPEKKKEEKQTKRKASEESSEKTAKKAKKDAATALLEQIDDNQNEEKLAKEDMVIRHRILNMLKYVQTAPGNPDRTLLNAREPGFLTQNFDVMSYAELKDAYKIFCNHKHLHGMISGIQNRYDGIEHVVHQFARHALGFDGDPSFLTGHLKEMKHEAVLSALAKSNPYKKLAPEPLDQLINIAMPVGTTLYGLYQFQTKKTEHEKQLDQTMSETEVEGYMSMLAPPPTSPLYRSNEE